MAPRLGIFAKTFARPTVEEVFDAVREHGLGCVQFNLSCAGLPTLPNEDDTAFIAPMCIRIRAAAQTRGVELAALSGTFNMIHPDPTRRADGLRRLRVLAAAAQGLGVPVITLCTGTRDPHDMWRWHPGNALPAAWADLLAAMETALSIAEEAGLALAVEPEHGNVVSSARRGRDLLDALRSPRLKIIIDPANLIEPGDAGQRAGRVLEEAFDLLGEDVIIAHAKDRAPDGSLRPAGQGVVDYPLYLRLLRQGGFAGPLILHGLEEGEVGGAVEFLRGVSVNGKP